MANVETNQLVKKLNPTCYRALDAGVGLCVTRTHFNVELEHWLLKLLDNPKSDIPILMKHFKLDPTKAAREIEKTLERFKPGNSSGLPRMSPDLHDLVREAWLYASVIGGTAQVRGGHLLLALVTDRSLGPRIRASVPEIGKIDPDKLNKDIEDVLASSDSDENADTAMAAQATPGAEAVPGMPAPGSKTPALDQFTQNLTEKAAKGGIDPVVGRDSEIRQVINILMGRRQNNPILTGEAGVGKTAVVEGLALRIAQGDVPEPLKNVVLRVLDLGLLQAGASMKGEFENRLKSVIQEVKASPRPIILFIDEAHTLIGAGGQAGQGDAANLLKPALARGELRSIAATTFAEYKKYFATDAALARRFQVVKVEEPDEHKAIRMLRGLVPMLEKHHNVRILEEALSDTVRLSSRYIPDRQLPDKAVSLLDKVCARVALSQSATPPALEDARREAEHLTAEIRYAERDAATDSTQAERVQELNERLKVVEARKAELEEQLGKEQQLATKVRELRSKVEAPPNGEPAPAGLKDELAALQSELLTLQGESPLVHPVVAGSAVAELVSGLTGIPVGKMVRDEVNTVLNLAQRLRDRVVGQDHALEAIGKRIATARADLSDPRRPFGVFLLVGPSGVGKTETAMALADLLYGGDRNMIVINMSEYKESSKVSRLTGTAKGYVGYGEGGVLTNAVKNKPYSVVLLDEVEKADESVQEIFYQVFDKGSLQNDDGEDINFKNTIVLLTSNAGTDVITKACADPDTIPDVEGLSEVLRPALLKTFKPALLGRMTVVPYYPLRPEVIKQIIEMQLKKIGGRLRQNYKADFHYDPSVIDTVANRCTEVESGARNVDHILTGTLLPTISREILTRLAEGRTVNVVRVGVGNKGEFTYGVE
jgi:type VI secretion system protein VasG